MRTYKDLLMCATRLSLSLTILIFTAVLVRLLEPIPIKHKPEELRAPLQSAAPVKFFTGGYLRTAPIYFFVGLSVVNVELCIFNARIFTPIRAGLTCELVPPMFYFKY